jgi:SAM-dependent methyltransferase
MTHAYYGPEYTSSEIEAFLQRRNIPFERFDEPELVERVADLIAAGNVVGWFRGRMEFGPRALGSRSILADATNPEMKAIINRKIKYREYFRPFAPAVPLENVHQYFEVEPGRDLPFMLKVPPVRAEMKARIPAVTHEDGTGRVQTVTEDVNPAYYHLLKAFGKRSGIPVLLNTSFNVRGEPIVCSPADAYDCFVTTGIDALVLGDFLIAEKPVEATDHEKGFARSDALEDGLEDESRILAIVPEGGASHEDATTGRVLGFYQELPFNCYSNAADTAIELMRANRLKEYPVLDEELTRRKNLSVLDVGCGAGWFTLSCAHHYGHRTTGIDINHVALRQARNVARFLPSGEVARFIETNLFEFDPDEPFDVVNSLGVLHHTPDCPAAVKRAASWVAPGGWFHLGLYHLYGRRPFLEHFKKMQDGGATNATLYREFARLTPDITDETHRQSWFRDQVLHPHETQHTLAEAKMWLAEVGFEIVATSLNGFRPMASVDAVIQDESRQESLAQAALAGGRYFPGFYVVWARRTTMGE